VLITQGCVVQRHRVHLVFPVLLDMLVLIPRLIQLRVSLDITVRAERILLVPFVLLDLHVILLLSLHYLAQLVRSCYLQ